MQCNVFSSKVRKTFLFLFKHLSTHTKISISSEKCSKLKKLNKFGEDIRKEKKPFLFLQNCQLSVLF